MNARSRTVTIAVFSAVAFVLVAGAAYAGYKGTVDSAHADEGATAIVKRGTIQSSVPADGRVVTQQWDLSFGSAGTVKSVNVAEGDAVVAGQVLATLFDGKADAQVTQSRAAVAAARAKLQTVREQPRAEDVAAKQALVDAAESGVASAQDAYDLLYRESLESTVAASELQSKKGALTAARSQLEVAKANLTVAKTSASNAEIAAAEAAVAQAGGTLDSAKSGLSDYTLTAPADGVVVSLGVSVGQVLGTSSGQESAVVIADLREVSIEGTLDEMDASAVTAGMPAEILIDALDGEIAKGRVEYVAPTAKVDQNGVAAFTMKVAPDTAVKGLAPGMAVRLQVVTDRVADVLTIPTAAVSRTGGAAKVNVIGPDGSARPVTVVLGKTDGKIVEVTQGLESGQKIAVPTAKAAAK
jgi:macrolide-specific efflux system membrane fusion protein